MSHYPIHTVDTAPEKSKPLLRGLAAERTGDG